jgi:MFS family permease
MGYVIGGAVSTIPVSRIQERFGRKPSFLIGIGVAIVSSLLCLLAATTKNFPLLVTATFIAGFYQANGHLYRFAAAELAGSGGKEKAVSWVLAGGILGAVAGPNIAAATKDAFEVPFAGAYLSLTAVGLVAVAVMSFIRFPALPKTQPTLDEAARPLSVIIRQPLFILATLGAALGYGVMNLLMAATPLAMQTCGFPFKDAALVLEWHVIGMFAPGFFTGHLIQRYGALTIMTVGVLLNILCIGIALTGVELHQFLIALFVLGVGWNFLFTASTTLSLKTYSPSEKDRAQAAINLAVFSTMVLTSFGSGALVTTQGWAYLNVGSLIPMGLMGIALLWAALRLRSH